MLRVLYCLSIALLLALVWPASRAAVQPADAAAAQKAAEFSGLYQRWQQAQDPEQKIAVGEELLALEPTLASWPLDTARTQFRANIQADLGIAYATRAQGVPADNLERAIAHLEAALTVWTRDAAPQDWARAHDNAGVVYAARVRGVAADNLETAIAHLEAALTVWTREASPQDWARSHMNAGVAYARRIRGERADNQDKAIAHLEATLAVWTREAAPQEWGLVQTNLAVAYLGRLRGERSANVEAAIGYLEAVLNVVARESDPQRWATVQLNLASAYASRRSGADAADNQARVIAALEAALSVFTREAFPQEWAHAQNSLAVAYLDRTSGELDDNQEKGIRHYEAALTVFTREDRPEQWATTQVNLGNAYVGRMRGERAGNRGKAIAAYEAALTVFTREFFPHDHLHVAHLLARTLLGAGEWNKAAPHYASAREAFLLLFGQGLDETEARALIRAGGPLFSESALAAIERGETEAALELASEGRARLLAVALKLQALDLLPDQRRRLDELRGAVRVAQQATASTQGTERVAALDRLVKLRQELGDLVKTGSLRQSGSVLTSARAVVAAGGAIAVPIITQVGARILVLAKATGGKDISVVHLPQDTLDKLIGLLASRDDSPKLGRAGGWVGAYLVQYLEGAERDQLWPQWLDAIEDMGPQLWQLFGARLDAALKARGVAPGARLVLLPPGALGILPLGLAQDPASQRRLSDGYEIVYAPSLEALAAAHGHNARAGPATLAIVVNPTGDLEGTEREGRLVASYFPSKARTVLQGEAATADAVLAALKERTYWHFASHGTFEWLDPRQSGLIMHATERLSVDRLLEAEGLGRPRLVVLSACETGINDINVMKNPDEFIGLPGTFTALGAMGVIGTLWPVDDRVTALLIAKFYELHMTGRLPPSTALRRAQAWLRQATRADLNAYARTAAAQGRLGRQQVAEIAQQLSGESLAPPRSKGSAERAAPERPPATGKKETRSAPASQPYAHPYFWAAFTYTGL